MSYYTREEVENLGILTYVSLVVDAAKTVAAYKKARRQQEKQVKKARAELLKESQELHKLKQDIVKSEEALEEVKKVPVKKVPNEQVAPPKKFPYWILGLAGAVVLLVRK